MEGPAVLTMLILGLGYGAKFGSPAGGFLPLSTVAIKQPKADLVKILRLWIISFALGSMVFGCLSLIIPFIPAYAGMVYNIALIAFGTLTLLELITRNKKLTQLVTSRIFLVGFFSIQSVFVLHMTSAVRFFPDAPALALTVFLPGFIVAASIVVCVITLLLYLVSLAGTTGKLNRYLSGLFAFFCILLSILNFL